MKAPGLTPQALLMLIGVAFMFGANHVAARVAFDHGLDVVTAVTVRSLGTAAVVAALVPWRKAALKLSARQGKAMALIVVLVAIQSLTLYAAVARIPVGLALLTFNLYSLTAVLWSLLVYRSKPDRAVLKATPVIFLGLALALDVTGAASGLDLSTQWSRLSTGVALALAAALSFGLVLALTEHEVGTIDGRFRTLLTLGSVGVLTLLFGQAQGGLYWPNAQDAYVGWWGLALLTLFYGSAFTLLFTILPRLGVVGNSPIMNLEPVAALLMAWGLLGQQLALMQCLGAVLVVAAVVGLGLSKRAA
ncbi:MAG: DMT family transporter [Betaproteobacteria bacterium]|nr:DMT family transporter [Betaproteobacteria bacterium]